MCSVGVPPGTGLGNTGLHYTSGLFAIGKGALPLPTGLECLFRSIVWFRSISGVCLFLLTSPHVMLYFSLDCPVFLSTPLSYRVYVCMRRLMTNFAGTCEQVTIKFIHSKCAKLYVN